jgi:SAM-dependent methyltransferase
MLAYCRAVAPRAQFLVGQAEWLPFAAAAFDLITAAGSLDAASGNRFLVQAARVLAPGGVLIIYDFSAGRRFRENNRLQDWFAVFERRYPSPLGQPLAVRSLAFSAAGLRLSGCEALAVEIAMDRDAYCSYIMGQTGVEAALARGIPEAELRDWCQSTLAGVFGGQARTVIFDATIAYVMHTHDRL